MAGVRGGWRGIDCKGLSSNGAVCKCCDGMHFILRKLHGRKKHGEVNTLERLTHVVKEAIIGVILAEEG